MNTDQLKPYRIILSLLVFALCCGTQSAVGQVYSNTANNAKPVSYISYTGSDQLFVFYQEDGNLNPGSLSADAPDAGTFDFEWTKYDRNTSDFTIPVTIDNSVSTSSIGNLGEGGYRVRITNGVDVDTSFIGWIMLDQLDIKIDDDGSGNLPWGNSGCPNGENYLILNATATVDSYYYFDPITGDSISLVNDINILWTSDNPEIEIFNASRYLYLDNQVVPEPVEDTEFTLTATDSLGMTVVTSVYYDTKFTRAEYSVEYFDKITKEFDASLSTEFDREFKTGSLDAPLTVKFLNESKNGADFTWVFLDTINELTQEATKVYENVSDINYEPEFTYYTADKYYYPYLVSISDVGCIDTFKLEDGVRVVKSDLLIPNVFSPNGDGDNDIFRFKSQSLKECKLTIIDKAGRVVYRREINDIYAWEGWEGKILNSDRPAPQGPYYYIVEGTGYDNVEFKDPNILEKRKIERQNGGGTTTTPTTGTDGESQGSNIYTGWLYLYRTTGDF